MIRWCEEHPGKTARNLLQHMQNQVGTDGEKLGAGELNPRRCQSLRPPSSQDPAGCQTPPPESSGNEYPLCGVRPPRPGASQSSCGLRGFPIEGSGANNERRELGEQPVLGITTGGDRRFDDEGRETNGLF